MLLGADFVRIATVRSRTFWVARSTSEGLEHAQATDFGKPRATKGRRREQGSRSHFPGT